MSKEVNDRIVLENYELFKENIKFFVESDKDLQLKTSQCGITGVNPNVGINSSPRGIMAGKQFNQPIVLIDGEPNMIMTKTIYELGKYTINKKIENSAEVVGIIKRHYDYNTGEAVERIIIFKDLETNEVDAIVIPKFNRIHPYFGFNFVLPEDIDTLSVGDILPAGKVLAETPAKKENGGYGLGKDIMVALMPLPEADEDGVIFSDELKDMKFNTYSTITADIGEDSFLLNLHGDIDNYKPLLELGETIGEDGIALGFRNCDPTLAPVLTSKKALLNYNPIFDTVFYDSKAGGKIVDVKVFKNNNRRKTLPIGTTDYLDRYQELTLNYYRQIVDIYTALNKRHFNLTRTNLTVGNTFNRLVVEALGIVESSKPDSKLKKTHKLTKLKLYRIELVIEHTMRLSYGFKNTDESANKGVVTKFMPKKDMPIDKFGNRSQCILDVKSTPSRLNAGRIYERNKKGAMLKVTRLTREAFETMEGDTIEELSDDNIRRLFAIRNTLIQIMDNDLSRIYSDVIRNDKVDLMREALKGALKGFRMKEDLADEKRKYQIALDIMNSEVRPDKSTVTYTYNGKTVTTVDEIEIAPLYMYLLSKTASGELLTCASAGTNHYGLPTSPSKQKRGQMGYANNPLRFLGETETRVVSAFSDPEFVAEMIDIDSSVISHEEVYSNILKADKPSNMENHIDRKKIPLGKGIPLTILKTLLRSGGSKLEYKSFSDEVVSVSEKRGINIFDNQKVEKVEV